MAERKYVDPDKPMGELILGRWRMKAAEECATVSLHTHNFCEFTLVTAGRGMHLVNGAQQIMECGQLCFVRDRDVHTHRMFQGEEFAIYNQGIPAHALEEIARFYHFDLDKLYVPPLPPLVQMQPDAYARLNNLLGRLQETPHGEARAFLFRMCVGEVLWAFRAEEEHALPEWLAVLTKQMEQPDNFIAGLPRLIELSGYSQAYVNRCFQKYLQKTPTQYVNGLRLEYAVGLMAYQGMHTLDACMQSGFGNYGYFYRIFRQRYGVAPAQMRAHGK